MQKSNSGKNSVGGSVIAAICIIIYLCALVQGSVRIYLSIDQRLITAKQEFSQIADIAISAGLNGFMDENYVQTMTNALNSSRSLEALIITGADGGHAFEKKAGHVIKWVNNSPRFIDKIGLTNQDMYRPLPDARNANIKAVASIFDYNAFYRILKDTLIIIMIGFALSFFTMLLQLLTGRQEKPKGEMIFAQTPKQPVQQNSETKREAVFAKPARDMQETGPKGLYSPRSNIGWEEYTQDRLDSELHRCSSTEKDLALILIEFNDINGDFMFKQASEEAVNFFTSRDLLFEYGNNGISVILPGIGFDIAITKAEKFYQRIIEKFPNSFGAASNLCIGLSSRSGRLLNADRLFIEAKEALKKAKNDSKTSIIAFKSDPEKYRDYIRTHS
ncbi:MAG: hypothetical protein FWD14_04415 [Treponema sp.]|nr:hypothetical protein [Treponema sp.]